MEKKQRVLIVEDEKNIVDILRFNLRKEGYDTQEAYDGEVGPALALQEAPDLILLDLMMPQVDGYTVCRQIRQESQVPIVVLTALDGEDAQVKAFQLKADDYITEPFSLQVVLLRVEAVLRRAGNPTASSQRKQYTWRALCLDPEARSVTLHGQRVALTQLEFDLLALLLAHPHQVFTRAHLLQSVWGYDFLGEERAVNIHIMNLRRKLGREIIETVRGVGYRLGDET